MEGRGLERRTSVKSVHYVDDDGEDDDDDPDEDVTTKGSMASYESLNFTTIDNKIRREYTRTNTSRDYKTRTLGKWFLCFLIGVAVGMLAYAIRICVETLNAAKFALAHHYYDAYGWQASFFSYLGINIALATGSYFLVKTFGTKVSSSGIPEVMSYLNGVRVEKAFNVLTFIAKAISLILSFSASLVLGPEGPMIHLGSLVGAAISQFKSKTLGIHTRFLWQYRNDSHKRDFISCGAAAGISAAFGAPIGGVLFAIEEATTYWSHQLTWHTFFCCMTASFTVNIIQNIIHGTADVHDFGLLTFGFSNSHLYRAAELIVFVLLGVLGGLIGTAFIKLNLAINKWRRDFLHKKHKLIMLAEVLAVVVLTSILFFSISLAFPCRYESNLWQEKGFCNKVAHNVNETLVSLGCEEGSFNDMATLFFSPSNEALPLVYSRINGIFSVEALSVFVIIYLLLASVTSGIWVAGGLFVPMMMIGACVGRIVGRIVAEGFPHIEPAIDPSIYALVGSVGVMTGFCRMTISIVVIYAELTETTQFLLPIILVVMVSKWTADFFGPGLYHELIELKKIPFMHIHDDDDAHHHDEVHHHEEHNEADSHYPDDEDSYVESDDVIANDLRNSMRNVRKTSDIEGPNYLKEHIVTTVEDIMSTNVRCFREIEKVDTIVTILRANTHNGFPIISSAEQGSTYKGIILRKQLLILLLEKQFDESPPELTNSNDDLPPSFSPLSPLLASSSENRSHSSPPSPSPFLSPPLQTAPLTGASPTLESFPRSPKMRIPIKHVDFMDLIVRDVPTIYKVRVSRQQREMYVDLRPYYNTSAMYATDTFSRAEAYRVFMTLGLRHLPILDKEHKVVGMITRKDLI